MLPNPSTTLTRRVLQRSSVETGRRAFTLIELLVVITIIAVLMTMIISVVGAFLTQAKDAATKTTLNKIQGLLNSRAQAFDRLIQRNGYLTGSTEYTQQWTANVANGDANLQAIIARKLLQIKYFPQSVADFKSQEGGLALTLYPKISNGSLLTTPESPDYHNAEILYDFLTQENVLGGVPVGSDNFSASEVQDLNSNGFPEFVDAWGTPIRFYRWPTRLFRPNGTGTAIDPANARLLFSSLPVFSGNLVNDLARDPDDPLQSTTIVDTTMNSSGWFEKNFHTPTTYYVYLIVSAGPDLTFGMDDPNGNGSLGAVVNQAALIDDIVYLNIRAGGK